MRRAARSILSSTRALTLDGVRLPQVCRSSLPKPVVVLGPAPDPSPKLQARQDPAPPSPLPAPRSWLPNVPAFPSQPWGSRPGNWARPENKP